jgi:hypothetical protein
MDGQHRVEILIRQLLDAAVALISRIVNEDVDPTEMLQGRGDDRLGPAGVATES